MVLKKSITVAAIKPLLLFGTKTIDDRCSNKTSMVVWYQMSNYRCSDETNFVVWYFKKDDKLHPLTRFFEKFHRICLIKWLCQLYVSRRTISWNLWKIAFIRLFLSSSKTFWPFHAVVAQLATESEVSFFSHQNISRQMSDKISWAK